MGSREKGWKDALLSSGLPLEFTCRELVRPLGMADLREYLYYRPNENGFPTQFSVDLYGCKYFDWTDINASLFMECKYRHENVKWVFTPYTEDEAMDEQFYGPVTERWFNPIDTLACVTPNWRVLNLVTDGIPRCGKGIELLPDGPNPKAIREAVEQLRYAVASEAPKALSTHLIRTRVSNPAIFLVPIVVTTAELWRLSPTVDLPAVKEARDLSEVASQEKAVLLFEPPDIQLAHYSRDAFFRYFRESQAEQLSSLLKDKWGDFAGFVDYFSNMNPSYFLVVHLDYLRETVENLFSVLALHDAVIPNTSEVQPGGVRGQ